MLPDAQLLQKFPFTELKIHYQVAYESHHYITNELICVPFFVYDM